MPFLPTEIQRVLAGLAAQAAKDAITLLTRSGDRLDKREALRFITEAFPELVSPFIATAGDLAATIYEELPGGIDGFQVVTADLPPIEQLATNGRYALLGGSSVAEGVVTRIVMAGFNDTTFANLAAEYGDPEIADQPDDVLGTLWARHASANACGFCRMNATKGAVYRSKQSATRVTGRGVDLTVADQRAITLGLMSREEALQRRSVYRSVGQAARLGKEVGDKRVSGRTRGKQKLGDKFHDWCKCTAIAVRPGGSYEPAPYVEQWQADYDDAVDSIPLGTSHREVPKLIAAHMDNADARRREQADTPSSGAPSGARAPLALPAGQSAGQLAIEAPKRQLALNRKPAPLAIEGPRQLLALTAAPDRPAVTPPDPHAIADWLDAEDDHRHALEYWRRVDAENLHSLPAEEVIPEPPRLGPLAARVAELEAELEASANDTRGTAKKRTQRRDAIRLRLKEARRAQEEARAAGLADEPVSEPAVELVTPDPDPVVDVQVDDHAGETELDRAVREFEEALASGDDARIDAAAEAMERAEQAERAAAERREKAAARRGAARDADRDRVFELIEGGEDPQTAEAMVLSSNADGRRRVAKVVAAGHHTEEEAAREVFNHILERVRRRDFMAQARAEGHSGRGFDDLLDSVFQRRADELYYEAEDATRGQMVKRQYASKFDPKRFWYCNDATARKYMSDELAEWFDENGRLTRPVMRQMILDGSTNFGNYTAMRADYLE